MLVFLMPLFACKFHALEKANPIRARALGARYENLKTNLTTDISVYP
jgi:hypothetical protein